MKIITNKERAFKIIEKSRTGLPLKNFSSELRDDADIIRVAVFNDANALKYASERLSNDRTIIMQAVKRHASSFKYASPEIKKDRKFILEILHAHRTSGELFKYCDPQLQQDRSFVLEFVKNYNFALKYIPKEFSGDREIALVALDKNTSYFQYIKKSLRDEIEITKEALSNPYNFKFIAKKYQSDEEMVLLTIKNLDANDEFPYLEEMGSNLKSNKDFFLKVIKTKVSGFKYASDELKQDCDLLKLALKKSGCKINYPYTNSKELIAPQIRNDSYFFNFASEEIKNDRGIVLEVLEKDPANISYASKEIQNMLGNNEKEYITRLKKIIAIESLADKLDKSLVEKGASTILKI